MFSFPSAGIYECEWSSISSNAVYGPSFPSAHSAFSLDGWHWSRGQGTKAGVLPGRPPKVNFSMKSRPSGAGTWLGNAADGGHAKPENWVGFQDLIPKSALDTTRIKAEDTTLY